jgi:carboxylesterase type B
LKQAREFNTPVVLVQINYRLGAFGTAVSPELTAELNGGSKTHPVGNYALIDQRNALEWANQHIQDFGGDPSNITVFGVSAGSASIHTHLMAGESHQLFDRAIMMSGAAPAIGPLPLAFYESEWEALCQNASVDTQSAASALAELRRLSPRDLIRHYSKNATAPVADGKLIPDGWRFEDEVPRGRCQKIIMGDTNVEGLIFDGMLQRHVTQQYFHERAQAGLSPALRAEVYDAFGFTSEPQAPEDFRRAFRLLIGNVNFNFPNVGIAEQACTPGSVWKDDLYLYHFEATSNYEGPTFGLSYHGFCALMLYLNELEHASEDTQRVSLETARLWTAFAHGQRPWEAYSEKQRFLRLGPDTASLQSFETDTTRVYKFLGLLREHFTEVEAFMRDVMGKENP